MTFDPFLIAKLNNQAVRNLVAQHSVDSSIRDFATALKAVHQALASLSSSSSSSQQQQQQQQQQFPRTISLADFPKSLLSIDNWMESASSDVVGPLYVYSHPIHIPAEVTAVFYEAGRWPESERTVDDKLIYQLLKLVTIAITFNIAVAFQQQAATAATPKVYGTLVKRSLKMFQQSFDICRNTYKNITINISTGSTSSSTTLFSLAALNNVAVLHKSVGDSETSSAGFQSLLSSLMACTVFETDSSKTSRYTAFFHNTAKLSYPDCSICAASA